MKTIIFLLTFTTLIFAIQRDENFPVYEEILPNGLRLLVVSDTTLPTVTARLYYFVGSMHESFSHTGLSHMFEHMMFKGTKRLGTTNFLAEVPFMKAIDSLDNKRLALIRSGVSRNDERVIALRDKAFALLEQQREFIIKDEIWSIYERHGGTRLNAWTSRDMTAYIVTLPANKIELFANIESDRMQNLVLREFISERDVVIEERKMVVDNRPLSRYFEILETVFHSAHPYQNPIIGWASDIENFTKAALKNHIAQFYRPDNALIVLAGNICPQNASRLINKYFAHIQNPKEPLPIVHTREPEPIGEKRFLLRENNAEPRVDIMFHTPGFPDENLFALEIVQNMLSGNSGILFRRLVEQEGLAVNVGAFNSWRHHNGRFSISVTLRAGVDHRRVEDIILEEIANLTNQDPSPDELRRVQNQILRSHLEKFRDMERFSDELAFFQRFGDWRTLFEYPQRIAEITSTKEVVARFLNPNYRVVGWIINE